MYFLAGPINAGVKLMALTLERKGERERGEGETESETIVSRVNFPRSIAAFCAYTYILVVRLMSESKRAEKFCSGGSVEFYLTFAVNYIIPQSTAGTVGIPVRSLHCNKAFLRGVITTGTSPKLYS